MASLHSRKLKSSEFQEVKEEIFDFRPQAILAYQKMIAALVKCRIECTDLIRKGVDWMIDHLDKIKDATPELFNKEKE